jgi:hypothetical protein
VNQFIKSKNPRLTPQFPNLVDLEFTGYNEFCHIIPFSTIGPKYQGSLCPPEYFSSFARTTGGNTPVDSDILPVGTQYQVTNLLDGVVATQGSTSYDMTLVDLKNQVLQNGALRHGYYSLMITVNNQVHYLKILKQ